MTSPKISESIICIDLKKYKKYARSMGSKKYGVRPYNRQSELKYGVRPYNRQPELN
jgi:hypothetical protein